MNCRMCRMREWKLTSRSASSGHKRAITSATVVHMTCSTAITVLATILVHNSVPAMPTEWRDRAEGCRCNKGQTKCPISIETMFGALRGTLNRQWPPLTLLPSPIYATICSLCLALISLSCVRGLVWINSPNSVEAPSSPLSRILGPALWACHLRKTHKRRILTHPSFACEWWWMDVLNSSFTVRWLHNKYNCFLISAKFSLSGASGLGENQPSSSCHCENVPPFGPTEFGMLSSNLLHTNCNEELLTLFHRLFKTVWIGLTVNVGKPSFCADSIGSK